MINTVPAHRHEASARASLSTMLTRIDHDIDQENQWEAELDILGVAASPAALYELLSRAPNPDSTLVHYLMGYLLSVEVNPRSSQRDQTDTANGMA